MSVKPGLAQLDPFGDLLPPRTLGSRSTGILSGPILSGPSFEPMPGLGIKRGNIMTKANEQKVSSAKTLESIIQGVTAGANQARSHKKGKPTVIVINMPRRTKMSC